jgi:hypothetical protein
MTTENVLVVIAVAGLLLLILLTAGAMLWEQGR